MQGTIVGVLRGGPSREHEVSLQTGQAMLSNLSAEHFAVRDIYIDRQGVWHERGAQIAPERILQNVDVVLNGLHGEYGEDGEVQKLLERYNVPYVGSNSLASFLAMHKVLAKHHAEEAGLKTPRFRLAESPEDISRVAQEAVHDFLQPVVVKPVRWGSSIGVSVVSGYAAVEEALNRLFAEGAGAVMVEECIRGREATVGVVENLRGETLYALPPTEIIPPASAGFFSAEVKYTGATQEICPADFSPAIKRELAQAARTAHHMLGLRHYSRSDFIVSPHGVYFLETNTLPGLTNESLLPRELAAVGISLKEFFSHLVSLALNRV